MHEVKTEEGHYSLLRMCDCTVANLAKMRWSQKVGVTPSPFIENGASGEDKMRNKAPQTQQNNSKLFLMNY
ncbi:hypothetical protein DMENIID0001_145060 [Sergentomyia squamirostris]